MHQFRTLTTRASDPYRALQHSLDTLEVDAAHMLSSGAGVRVAVIDSGIDASHHDLNGVVRARRDSTGGGPLAPHGTEVAGVISARGANGAGIMGVAPEAQLADLRACRAGTGPNAPADCDSYTLALALDYAVNSRVDVINLSLAGPEDPLLARLLAGAEAQGIAVVARLRRRPAAMNATVSGFGADRRRRGNLRGRSAVAGNGDTRTRSRRADHVSRRSLRLRLRQFAVERPCQRRGRLDARASTAI